jgi:hypothetical protein
MRFWDHPVAMSQARQSSEERAHDVLAAEAFAVPAPDPALHQLHHEPVRPPEDPLGTEEPHDVLAAEEFPMPAVPRTRRASLTRTARESLPLLGVSALLGSLAAALLFRLLRRA